MNTYISTDVLMYLNETVSTYQFTMVSTTGVSMYVCYRLNLLYQCISEPILLLSANNVRTKCILRAKYVYRCMTVSAYNYMLELAYLLCMYRLEEKNQCIRINPSVIGKECKNKMYLES
jgi:hypothetical protein